MECGWWWWVAETSPARASLSIFAGVYTVYTCSLVVWLIPLKIGFIASNNIHSYIGMIQLAWKEYINMTSVRYINTGLVLPQRLMYNVECTILLVEQISKELISVFNFVVIVVFKLFFKYHLLKECKWIVFSTYIQGLIYGIILFIDVDQSETKWMTETTIHSREIVMLSAESSSGASG